MQYKLSIQEYTAALRENRLLGLKCHDCGTVTAPPRMACRKCSGLNLEISELSGKGKIVTFTAVYVPPQSFIGKTPYLIVMVELDEGPWIMGNLAGIDPCSASIDLIDKNVKAIKRPPSGEKPEDGTVPLFLIAD
jgi:uncharacterized OB-fold protein